MSSTTESPLQVNLQRSISFIPGLGIAPPPELDPGLPKDELQSEVELAFAKAARQQSAAFAPVSRSSSLQGWSSLPTPVEGEEHFHDAASEASVPGTTGILHLPALPVLLGGCAPLLTDAAAALVDDSFWRCFRPVDPDLQASYLNTWYLHLLWFLGFCLRYCILLPIRLYLVALGYAFIYPPFFLLKHCAPQDWLLVRRLQQVLVGAMCRFWLTVFTAAVRYRGPEPSFTPGHVWVANHTSMIDYHLLAARHPFACLMQQQPGALGWVQRHVWSTIGCINFDRQGKDRVNVVEAMRAHVHTPGTTPLLVFPEGVCSNNRYALMFKRGAFSLDATVCPIAISYNKSLSDPFWHKGETFIRYMLRLMSSWAVVADITFLPPQQKRADESADEFAARVRDLIAAKAGLQPVPWDGMLKYYQLGPRRPALIQLRQAVAAEVVAGLMGHPARGPGVAAAAAALAAALGPGSGHEEQQEGMGWEALAGGKPKQETHPEGQANKGTLEPGLAQVVGRGQEALKTPPVSIGSPGPTRHTQGVKATAAAGAAAGGGVQAAKNIGGKAGGNGSGKDVAGSVAAALADGSRVSWDWGIYLAAADAARKAKQRPPA